MIYIENSTATQYIAIPFAVEYEGSGDVTLTLSDAATGEAITIAGFGSSAWAGDYIVMELELAEKLREGEYHYEFTIDGEGDDYTTKGVAVVGAERMPYVTEETATNIIQYER